MFPEIASSTLLVIDVQERLLPAIHAPSAKAMLKHVGTLLAAFDALDGAVVYTEQYVRGLGPTVAELAGALEGRPHIEKMAFSAASADRWDELEPHLSDDVVVAGIEAHVCVLQTVRDLLAAGRRVWLPLDAVASRDPRHRDNALDLAAAAGARVINTESLVFAALGRADHPDFKPLSRRIK